MKKPIIILVSALVLAGSSMGAFLAVKHKRDTEANISQAEKEDNVLFNINSAGIKKVEFGLEDGDYVAELNDSGVWVLTNRDDFALDQVYMQLICTYTSDLTAQTAYLTIR